MSLPPKSRFLTVLAVLLVLVALREWNIRRHEPAMGDWPRAGSERSPT